MSKFVVKSVATVAAVVATASTMEFGLVGSENQMPAIAGVDAKKKKKRDTKKKAGGPQGGMPDMGDFDFAKMMESMGGEDGLKKMMESMGGMEGMGDLMKNLGGQGGGLGGLDEMMKNMGNLGKKDQADDEQGGMFNEGGELAEDDAEL